MATTAIQDLKFALIKTYTAKSTIVFAQGSRVKFGTTDNEIDLAAANDDLAIGTALIAGTGTADGKVKIQVALDGHEIVPMLVGTGGATRGNKAIQVADGMTNAQANGGGTLPHGLVGIFMQTGVVGDLVGVMPLNGRFVAAT